MQVRSDRARRMTAAAWVCWAVAALFAAVWFAVVAWTGSHFNPSLIGAVSGPLVVTGVVLRARADPAYASRSEQDGPDV